MNKLSGLCGCEASCATAKNALMVEFFCAFFATPLVELNCKCSTVYRFTHETFSIVVNRWVFKDVFVVV